MWDFIVDIALEGVVAPLVAFAMIVAMIVALGRFFDWVKERRDRARICAIAEVEEGKSALVEGKIVALETISSPYRGQEAVIANLWTMRTVLTTERQYNRLDGTITGPETITFATIAKDFLIDDGSGVLVRVDASFISWRSSPPKFGPKHDDGVPEYLWEFLEASGLDMNELAASPSLSFAEDRLVAGDRVRVEGIVRFEVDPDGDRGYRDISRRPVLVAPEDKEVMIERI